jgi:hypothetical protein
MRARNKWLLAPKGLGNWQRFSLGGGILYAISILIQNRRPAAVQRGKKKGMS